MWPVQRRIGLLVPADELPAGLDIDVRAQPLVRAAASSATDLLGRRLLDVFPAIKGSIAEEQIREVLGEGNPRQFEYFYEPQDRWFEVRAFPDPDGVAVFFKRFVDVLVLHLLAADLAAPLVADASAVFVVDLVE